MQVRLVAVQPRMRLEHYQSAETFEAKIMALTEAALTNQDKAPTLLAFPELIGMPLLFTLGAYQRARTLPSLPWVALELIRRNWRDFLKFARDERRLGLDSFYNWRALPAYRAYTDAFAKAAKSFGVTVVAGSTFLPQIEKRGGQAVIVNPRVHNRAYLFGNAGEHLGQSPKCYLTPGSESHAGLSRASVADLPVFDTAVGRLGVAICLDGFYRSVIRHFDALGAEIIVQPSANEASWTRPWPADPALSEGEAWLRYGLREQLQRRRALRYGVNPMLVADLFGLSFRGRSSIVTNTQYIAAETEGYPGLLAIAETSHEETFVRYQMTS